MFCRGVTSEHLLFGRGQMAMRCWSSSMHGLSLAGLQRVRPSCQLLCHFSTVKASVVAFSQARDPANSAALEEPVVKSGKKKERLSRQERTALVESFVLKHMEAHQGAFPSLSVVLKETGGGRNVVKDILNDLEGRYALSDPLQNSTDTSNTGDANADIEDTIVNPSYLQDILEDAVAGDPYINVDIPGTFSKDDKVEEEQGQELLSSKVDEKEIRGDSGGGQGISRESVTLTDDQTGVSSQDEIEIHSGLWSRLREMGTSQSLGQISKQQPRSQDASSSRRLLPREELLETNSRQESDSTSDSVALSYTNSTESEPKNSYQNGGWKEESGSWSLKDTPGVRHGLFVRYLSPQATPADMRDAFADCGEIVRAQAIKSRTNSKYTYGFVDFKTVEGLKRALDKEKVYIKGVRIQKEPSSSTPRTVDRSLSSNGWAADFRSSRMVEQSTGSLSGLSKAEANGYKVAVWGIPMHIPLSEVQKALSKYGEIILSDMKQGEPGSYSANLEFKTDDAREKALLAKSVQLNGTNYLITMVDPVKTSVVRISNVDAEAIEEHIGATCELFGRVERVRVRCDDTVDVYFQATELENMPRILSRLNEVTMDGERWQAQLLSCMVSGTYESLLNTRDGQEWLQLESERMLTKVETSLKKLVVDVEDLQELVKAHRRYIASQKNNRTPTGLSSFY